MKKVLIYYPDNKLFPKGGPSGYLYNLKQGIVNTTNEEIEVSFYFNSQEKIEDNQKLRNKLPRWLKDIRRTLKYSHYLNYKYKYDKSLLEYDAIHFHNTEDVYMNREVLNDYHGKVILTTHAPCAPFLETLARINPIHYSFFKKKLDRLEQMDIYAYSRADYIIFPCEDAEEPYYHTWPKYKSLRDGSKYKYMTTGISKCHVKIGRDDLRKKYNIPEDALVVSYVGRHNNIKGYDNLKKIGQKLLEDENIYFLIAGKEEPLKGYNNNRWIEVGWTNDPHSLIAASDVFVLPNKETYFDLVLLEVISLGVPVVISNTGGNKYFEKYKLDGIKIYDSLDDACEKIYKLMKMNIENRQNMREDIEELFEAEFTVEKFTKRYFRILEEILEL